jgi:NADPH-dependent ferric siderophore reductase
MIDATALRFPEPQPWELVVAAIDDITPHMRRIQLTGPALDRFTCLPGQDLSLGFNRDGAAVRRRYTIRRFDRDRHLIELDILLHGDGPGMRWAQTVKPGAAIEAIGPRGKITLAHDADWHLFAGDATAVPAALAMMEALPPLTPARAFLQIDGPEDRQSFPDGPSRVIHWHYDPSDATALPASLTDAELPPGRGHAYLAGEVSLVLALKSTLLARGWEAELVSSKAYWNRGRANAGNGEPERRAT